MSKFALIFFTTTIVFSSCQRYSYFQSPMQTNTNVFKEIPLHSDEIPAATYATGTFSATAGNDKLMDNSAAFLGSVHRSHNFSRFQAYYGLAVALGNYSVGGREPQINEGIFPNRNLNDSLILARSGNKFFGSVGFNGGIGFVQPWGKGGEWRILQLGFSLTNEFGEYLQFRKNLPDTAANLIARSSRFLSLSISTDFVAKIKKGNFGYQLSYIIVPRKMTGYLPDRTRVSYGTGYISGTIHMTKNRITGFIQSSLGSATWGGQLGASYRLTRN